MYTLTWYDRSSLMVWSLQVTRTSWAGHCGLFIALAVSNCSPLLYSLTDIKTVKYNQVVTRGWKYMISNKIRINCLSHPIRLHHLGDNDWLEEWASPGLVWCLTSRWRQNLIQAPRWHGRVQIWMGRMGTGNQLEGRAKSYSSFLLLKH